MADLGLRRKERAFQDQRDVEDALLLREQQSFAERSPAIRPAASPAASSIIGPASKTGSSIPGLSAAEPSEPGVPATFENLLGPGAVASISPTGATNVRPEDLAAAGGIEGILEAERPTTIGVAQALDVTDNLLGRASGTQRAELQDLSNFQKAGLFVADIIAFSQGRVSPSAQLDTQRFRATSLQEQADQQSFLQGLQAMKDTLDLVENSPKDQRVEIMSALVPQLEGLSPNLGAIGLSIASKDSEREAIYTFLNDPTNMTGTDAHRAMNWATAVAGYDADAAAKLIDSFIQEGVFTNTIDHMAPSIVARIQPDQIEAGRRQGGAQEDFANRWASGAKITPSEYEVFNSKLPENVKTPPSVMESYGKDRNRFFDVFPGQFDAEALKLARDEGIKAEFSAPITLVNVDDIRAGVTPPRIASGPGISERMRKLQEEGWVIAKFDRQTTGEAGGPGDLLNPFAGATVATASDMQKAFGDARVASNELRSIRESYSKDLLTVQARLKDLTLSVKSAVGIDLTAQETEFRERFITLQTKALTALSAVLNRLSGAAVSPQEFERLSATMPSPGMDPEKFRIVMETRINEINFAIARFNVHRLTGGNVIAESYNLRRSDVRGFVVDKLAELTTALAANAPGKAPSDPAIQEQALGILASELGLESDDVIGLFPG